MKAKVPKGKPERVPLLAEEFAQIPRSSGRRSPTCGKRILEILVHVGGLAILVHKVDDRAPGGVLKEGCAHLIATALRGERKPQRRKRR